MEENNIICHRRGKSFTHICDPRVKSRGSQLVFPAPSALLQVVVMHAQVPGSAKGWGEGGMNINTGHC